MIAFPLDMFCFQSGQYWCAQLTSMRFYHTFASVYLGPYSYDNMDCHCDEVCINTVLVYTMLEEPADTSDNIIEHHKTSGIVHNTKK